MDISTIKLILDVARLESLAGVARARGVDPSSVSRSLAQAEAALGVRLFQRTTRRLTLTEAGSTFVRRMAPVVDEYDRGVEDVRGSMSRIDGTIRLTTSVAYGQTCVVPLLPLLRDRFPNLKLELHLSDTNLDLVEHRVDLAIRLGPSVTGDVVCAKLRDTRYRVCASPAYLDRSPELRCPSDLEDHSSLLFSLDDYRTRWIFRDEEGRTNEVPVHGQIVISSALGLREAALAGLGPVLLADWLIDNDIGAGRLVDLFPTYDVTATSFETAAWIVYPSRSFLPRRVRAVIDFFREMEPPAGINP